MTLSNEKISESAERLHRLFNEIEHYTPFYRNIESFSGSGLVITFETGQKSFGYDRIVHVGESGNLSRRIREFFMSIERNATLKRHVGAALINQANEDSVFAELWWENSHGIFDENYRAIEEKYMAKVFEYIKANMTFTIVPFPATIAEKRSELKDKILYTLGKYNEKNAFNNWLGNASPRNDVRTYGLWAEKFIKSEQILTQDDFVLLENLLENSGKL